MDDNDKSAILSAYELVYGIRAERYEFPAANSENQEVWINGYYYLIPYLLSEASRRV